MFSQVSVCQRGVSAPLHAGVHTRPGPEADSPGGDTTPEQKSPRSRQSLRSACWEIRATSGRYGTGSFLISMSRWKRISQTLNISIKDRRTCMKKWNLYVEECFSHVSTGIYDSIWKVMVQRHNRHMFFFSLHFFIGCIWHCCFTDW